MSMSTYLIGFKEMFKCDRNVKIAIKYSKAGSVGGIKVLRH